MTTLAEVEPRSHREVFDHWFERTVLIAILLNPGLLAWSLLDDAHEDMIETVHQGFLILFTAEMVIRFAEVGFSPKRFLKDPWNDFDLTLIALSWLPVIGGGVFGLRLLQLARFARIFHAMRHLSTLRIARMVHLFKGAS